MYPKVDYGYVDASKYYTGFGNISHTLILVIFNEHGYIGRNNVLYS